MRIINSKFVRCVEKSRDNMLKGRRKQRTQKEQMKSMICTRATIKSTQCNNINSPMKKEAKLSNNIDIKTDNPDEICPVTECKSPLHIDSYFYASITDVKNKASIVDIEERFYANEQINVQSDILTDVGHFRTDETPVAVPIHSPSTPHRINMPNNQLEDLDEGNGNNSKHNKPISQAPVVNSVQQAFKKPGNRGRRKLSTNQTISQRSTNSSNDKDTNHKLTDYFPVRRSIRKSKKAVLEEKQRDMENKVLCQVEEGLEVRHFAGKGRGVVTTREFTKGEFVVEYIGELIDQVTAKKREKIYAQDQNTGCYMYYFQHRNHQYCVDATAETDKLGRLVNHSRNGNLVARVIEVGTTPHLVLTAKENISIGVEVTYDYGDRSREAIRHHPWLAL